MSSTEEIPATFVKVSGKTTTEPMTESCKQKSIMREDNKNKKKERRKQKTICVLKKKNKLHKCNMTKRSREYIQYSELWLGSVGKCLGEL